MSKSALEDVYDFESLYQAHLLTRRGRRHKEEVMRFEQDLTYSLVELSERVACEPYQIEGYIRFMVYEPKAREVQALRYPDRVAQRSLCDQFLTEFITRQLIYDNAACIKKKGTHFALSRTEKFMKQHYHSYGDDGWILKGDISKFFASMEQNVLRKLVFKKLDDQRMETFLDTIIGNYHTPGSKDRGVPMGSMSSQLFSLLYLNPLDRFVKEELKVKWYSRYMDDFVLIHQDRKFLKQALVEIQGLIEDELKLTLNPKTQIFPLKNGVDYLGFHTYLTDDGAVVKKIRRDSKKRVKSKIRAFNRKYKEGSISNEEIQASINGWLGHAKHGDTHALRTEIIDRLEMNDIIFK